MGSNLKPDQFIQINIVVRDIEAAATAWAAVLGRDVPEIRLNHLESEPEYPYTYRGKESSCDLKVCDIDMGSFVIELHQPMGGPDTFQEYLERHGNGVHHLGFEVGENREAVLKKLSDLGIDTNRTVGYYPGSSWTIVDSEDLMGVNLNIKPVR